jgi:hypothetical protein
MRLVHLCCVIASFLVNMLFLNIKSGLFIIRLFFPTVRTEKCNAKAPCHPHLIPQPPVPAPGNSMPPSVTSRKSRGENLKLTSRHYQTRACNPSQKPFQGFKHNSPTRSTTKCAHATRVTTARHQAGRARISRNSGRSGARTGYLRLESFLRGDLTPKSFLRAGGARRRNQPIHVSMGGSEHELRERERDRERGEGGGGADLLGGDGGGRGRDGEDPDAACAAVAMAGGEGQGGAERDVVEAERHPGGHRTRGEGSPPPSCSSSSSS